MKRIILISSILILCISVGVFAAETVKNSTVSKGETREGIVALAGEMVQNEGQINDDFFAAGQTVRNNGRVSGDMIAAAQTLIIQGNVDGNIRAAGNDIILEGSTLKNVTVAGNNISIDKSATIMGTTMAAGSSILIKGSLNKSLYAIGNYVVIDGVVMGDAYINAEKISVAQGAKINGSLFYSSESSPNIASGTVMGKVIKKTPDVISAQPKQKQWLTISDLIFKLLWIAGSFFLGALLIKVFGKFFKETYPTIKTSGLKYIGIGILTLIAIPIISIIMIITVAGIPLAIASMIGYVLLIYLAKIPVALFVGGLINKAKNIYFKLLLGLIILGLINLIPYVGGLVGFFVMLMGLGLLVRNIFFKQNIIVPTE